MIIYLILNIWDFKCNKLSKMNELRKREKNIRSWIDFYTKRNTLNVITKEYLNVKRYSMFIYKSINKLNKSSNLSSTTFFFAYLYKLVYYHYYCTIIRIVRIHFFIMPDIYWQYNNINTPIDNIMILLLNEVYRSSTDILTPRSITYNYHTSHPLQVSSIELQSII